MSDRILTITRTSFDPQTYKVSITDPDVVPRAALFATFLAGKAVQLTSTSGEQPQPQVAQELDPLDVLEQQAVNEALVDRLESDRAVRDLYAEMFIETLMNEQEAAVSEDELLSLAGWFNRIYLQLHQLVGGFSEDESSVDNMLLALAQILSQEMLDAVID